mmetsp:Transcript_22233/g.46043  ORF Transcript_22233/g.46043 Transcript_22233/m.46043 type:complete len:216 (-) Transcript_22233:1123-1770(-)
MHTSARHPNRYADAASGLCSGPNLPPCKVSFEGCGTIDRNLALIGIPLVDNPSKCPMKIFHPKCQPREKEIPPLRNTLSAAAVPPTTRLIRPTREAPGEPTCIRAKIPACKATARAIAAAADAPRVFTYSAVLTSIHPLIDISSFILTPMWNNTSHNKLRYKDSSGTTISPYPTMYIQPRVTSAAKRAITMLDPTRKPHNISGIDTMTPISASVL